MLYVTRIEEVKSIVFSISHTHWFYHYFQAPFNQVSYQMIRDDKGPAYFSLNRENGEIQLRSGVDIPSDNEKNYVVS